MEAWLLHLVFLILNDDFVIFYFRVWGMSNIMDNTAEVLCITAIVGTFL